MAFYEVNLCILGVINACIFYHQRRAGSASVQVSSKSEPEAGRADGEVVNDPNPVKYDASVRNFVKTYLVGHLLAFAGDWLQVCQT